MSSTDEIFVLILGAFTKNDMKLLIEFALMSDMRNKNSRGASTVPWGTKILYLEALDIDWFTTTCFYVF